MSLTNQLITLFLQIFDMMSIAYNNVNQIYRMFETCILDDTFSEIHIYNTLSMDKKTILNNTHFDSLLKLVFVKYILMYSVHDMYKSLEDILTRMAVTIEDPHLITEIVYFRNGHKYRIFAKKITDSHEITDLLKNPPMHKKYLHATVSDKINITEFVNEHISSFSENNQLTVSDLSDIYWMNKHHDEKILMDCYIKTITDDTIEEITFNFNDIIVLI